MAGRGSLSNGARWEMGPDTLYFQSQDAHFSASFF